MERLYAFLTGDSEHITRRRALLKLLAGGILAAGVIAALLTFDFHLHGGEPIIVLAAPGALALVGLLELVTGVSFLRISRYWDALRGWQRGVLGLIVAALAFVVMMAGAVTFATP